MILTYLYLTITPSSQVILTHPHDLLIRWYNDQDIQVFREALNGQAGVDPIVDSSLRHELPPPITHLHPCSLSSAWPP